MSTIQKIKRTKGSIYKATIRRAGLKTISKSFSTKKLAIQFSQRVESNSELMAAYGNKNRQSPHLSVIIDTYLSNEYKGKDMTEQQRKLSIWLGALGDVSVNNIEPRDISIAINNLPSHLSPASVNRHKAALSGVLSFACRSSLLDINPARLVSYQPENNARVRFLSNLDVCEWLWSAKGLSRSC